MKIVAAMLATETNCFSSVPIDWKDFGPSGPLFGQEAYDAFRHSGYALAGLLEVADTAGDVRVAIAACSATGAPTNTAAFDRMSDIICRAVEQDCDALFLELHGAMSTQDHPDAEGELLARIRKVRPDLPIALSLDLHGTVTKQIVDNCTTLVGYKTNPHTDMVETGRLAGKHLLAALRGEISPVIRHLRIPLLANGTGTSSDVEPMRGLIAAAKQEELADNVLAVSIFRGFPQCDVPEAGMGVAVMTNGDEDAARTVCKRIHDYVWARRDEFASTEFETLSDAIGRAAQATQWPVILYDPADSCNSGGSQDTMMVVAEALRQGLDGIAAGPICDPGAVDTMVRAGVGATVTLKIGGLTSSDILPAEPLELTGKVKLISAGDFVVSGPVFTGLPVALGRTVVLDTGPLELIVSEGRCEPLDLKMMRFVGIDPVEKKYVVVKSQENFRATYGVIAKEIIECNAPGFATRDIRGLKFKNVSREIYPLSAWR